MPVLWLWRAAGLFFAALGTVGIFVPLLPTVVFYILAAFCFARSNPAWEARLLADRRWGPHIVAWRDRKAIARTGKRAALVSLALSAAISTWFLTGWSAIAAPVAAVAVGTWIATRPDA